MSGHRMHQVATFANENLSEVQLWVNRTLVEAADDPDLRIDGTDIVPFVQTLQPPQALGGPTLETRFMGIVRYSRPVEDKG